jgi:hypothetical protein
MKPRLSLGRNLKTDYKWNSLREEKDKLRPL